MAKALIRPPKNRVAHLAESNGKPKVAKRPLVEVVAPISQDLFSGFIEGWIPIQLVDEIVGKESKGKGIQLYDEMETKDPTIYGLMQVRKSSVANLPWKILPATESPKDTQIAEFVTDVIKRIQKFSEDCYELMDGVAKGYAVSEILWTPRPDGKWGVAALQARRQGRFYFSPEAILHLSPIGAGMPPGKPVPERKFLLFRNGGKSENPYGDAVLKHCYWYYFFKKNGLKFWSVFLERFGQPAIDAAYKGTTGDPEKKELQAVLEDWQNGTALAHSDNIVVTLLEAQKSGTSSYEGFTEHCNREIAKAILGQSVLTDSGQPGTQVSPKVSNEVRRDLLLMDAATLQDVIEGQLIRWIVDFNFGFDVETPHFIFETEPEEDLTAAADRLDKLVRMGLPVSKQFLYDKFEIPAPAEGEELLEVPSPIPSFAPEKLPEEDLKEKRNKTVLLRAGTRPRVPEPPRNAIGRYDVASVARGRRRFASELTAFFDSMQEGMKQALSGNRPVQSAIEDFISERFPAELSTIVKNGNLNALRMAGQSMAQRLGSTLNENRFLDLANRYAQKHAYDLGAAQEMTKTIREIMGNRAAELADSGAALADIRDDLLAEFSDLSKSRAEMIAVTETQKAANWAATEMARESGLPLEAWFVGESTDEPLCLDLMAGNPFSLNGAEVGEIPHPNCQHRWIFARKAEEK